ncbi:LPXTG cell wall anchor domain-containing protein [Lactobacillus acidophilus]
MNNGTLPTITWTVNTDKSTGLTADDQKFAAVTTPDTITLSTDEAAKRGTDDGEWYLVSTNKNGEVSYGDPNSDTWKSDTPNKIADGYLVYKQKAQYNIHYIDVNGVENKTTYAPTDGHEFTDHLVSNVGDGKGIFVGDTPDATQKLWSPADYEKAGYVLVGLSDNAKGDLLGKQTLTNGVQDQYVYLKHAITPSTDKTPKEDVKAETVSQVRTISYRDAETGEKITDELKKYGITANVPDITQTIDYVRVPLYDAFNGMFLGFAAIQTDAKGFAKLDSNGKPEIKKDTNGQPIISTRDDKASWVPTGEHTDYPEQGSPDLTKYGYVKESSLEQKTNNKDGAQVDAKDGDPTQSGGHVDVYYFHEQEDVTYGNPKFNIDQKDVEKTFKRTIIYRGTKDGHTYEDVNGSPDGTHKYVQTTTFTRKAIVDAVTKKVIKYTPWTSTKTTLVEVISKTPTEVGYDNVDIKSVSARTVDPDKDPEDLGTTVVTYTVTPTPTPEPNPGNGGNIGDGGNTPDGGSEQPNNPGNNNEVPGNPGGDNETPKDDKTTPEKPDEHDDLKLKSPDEHNHAPKKEVNKTSNNTPRSERWNSNKSPKSENLISNSMTKSENVNNVTGSNSAVKSANSPETVKENTLPQTGEKETKASMFGLIALSVAGLLSVLVLDRKKKN